MKLKRYSVTVPDNYTPTREFWTKLGAIEWYSKFNGHAKLYQWIGGGWIQIGLWLEARSGSAVT